MKISSFLRQQESSDFKSLKSQGTGFLLSQE